jgi:hypothetical protein
VRTEYFRFSIFDCIELEVQIENRKSKIENAQSVPSVVNSSGGSESRQGRLETWHCWKHAIQAQHVEDFEDAGTKIDKDKAPLVAVAL